MTQILSMITKMNVLQQSNVEIYVGCQFFTFYATRVMKYEHTKIRFIQICLVFVDMKKKTHIYVCSNKTF